MLDVKRQFIQQLQADILNMQGTRATSAAHVRLDGLAHVEQAFPHAVFPLGALHEFVCAEQEQSAACGGFVAGLLSSLMSEHSLCLWICISRNLFPPALALFGIPPDHVLFVDAQTDRDVLWATEEGLKCSGITAVVTEIATLTVAQSRRLQLAAEQHQVTCFMLRNCEQGNRTSICAARWRITPVASRQHHGMPGVGLPRWEVELLKVRNGTPGKWLIEWSAGRFVVLSDAQDNIVPITRKAG